MRSMPRRWRLRVMSVCASLLAATPTHSFAEPAASGGSPVAYIDTITPSNVRLAEIGKIKRHGLDVAVVGKNYALLPGDEISVTRPGAIVMIRLLATNRAVAVTSDSDGHAYTVRDDDMPGFPNRLLGWYIAALRSGDEAGDGSAMAASRAVGGPCYNETGETNRPTAFRVPVLVSSRSQIAPGPRAIFVSWQGGAPPFSLTLSDTETGKTIAQTTDVRGACAAHLPRTDLQPGRYRLTLTDAHNVKEQEDSLFVVDQAPGEPRELRDAGLPEEAREIYTATWLAAQDRGIWAFEAQQRVASMDCHSAAVQNWLRQWGSAMPCNEAKR